ncbi:amidase [Blastococcus haudaquaticus]|uniref:Aspartyl/glutamyl-tRNA(Asn/Gln) amidotransferase subunit A n=1 Tax=Blastococcus haudaquaticus TaxID=1938745 RepID=A0A286H464_9ACTN|nr:amidase [Blastococcus haudaquaticus]SOE02074.1 aspartyl/glutamyl-tRNA(Asn/Gln) amidotransferase subunit A [Blastococcus haudaquaticus]
MSHPSAPTSEEPLAWTMAEAGERLAAGELSPVELTEAYLAAIAERDDSVNAYLTVTADRAREDAVRAEQELRSGARRGPLHGVPVALKDLIETAGIRTTGGSRILADHVPRRDAVLAQNLRAAGTVLLGKTSTHEYAYGGTSNNPHYGPTRNPWDRDRIPGGSSGGSAAAVVSGTAPGAVGTDTCGSVRIPAALCGCVGLKPTRGRVNLDGILPLAPSLDHGGPITRSVRDAALLLDAMTGTTSEWTAATDVPDLRGTTVGVPTRYFFELVDPGVRAAVQASLDLMADAGATVRPVDVGDLRPLVAAIFLRVGAEAQEVHRATFPSRREDYGPDLVENLSRPAPTEARLAAAEQVIAEGVAALLAALGEVDVLATPTTPLTAPPIGAQRVEVAGEDLHIEEMLTGFTSAFNAAGVPALTVPCGLVGGLPTGLQLVGRAGSEPTVVRVGAAYEALRGPAPWPFPGPS